METTTARAVRAAHLALPPLRRPLPLRPVRLGRHPATPPCPVGVRHHPSARAKLPHRRLRRQRHRRATLLLRPRARRALQARRSPLHRGLHLRHLLRTPRHLQAIPPHRRLARPVPPAPPRTTTRRPRFLPRPLRTPPPRRAIPPRHRLARPVPLAPPRTITIRRPRLPRRRLPTPQLRLLHPLLQLHRATPHRLARVTHLPHRLRALPALPAHRTIITRRLHLPRLRLPTPQLRLLHPLLQLRRATHPRRPLALLALQARLTTTTRHLHPL